MQIERDYFSHDTNNKPVLKKEDKVKKMQSDVMRIYSKSSLSLYDKLNVRFLQWQIRKALNIRR